MVEASPARWDSVGPLSAHPSAMTGEPALPGPYRLYDSSNGAYEVSRRRGGAQFNLITRMQTAWRGSGTTQAAEMECW